MSPWGDDAPLWALAQKKQRAERQEREERGARSTRDHKRERDGDGDDADDDGHGRAPLGRAGSQARPLTITQVVRTARRAIEQAVGTIWLEGEAASVKYHSSGHLYFVLKDDGSQIPAVMWRSDVRRLRFRIEHGQHLRCRAQLGIYERDGKFQVYVKHAEPAGLGADALALEQLKRKLAAEGLFDSARKRPLPRLPRRIGVVTSKSGAAVRDIIRTVQRRFPVPILIADAAVQGEHAAAELVRAIVAIGKCDVDVIIVGRGGGAATDLAAFNDEAVVRAVAACPVPTISAVGHEVDISLADMVADCRAATPTAAGERAVPVLSDLARELGKEEHRLAREVALRIRDARQELDDYLAIAQGAVSAPIDKGRTALAELRTQLEARHPRTRIAHNRADLNELVRRMDTALARPVAELRATFAALEGRLDEAMRRRLERGSRAFALLGAQLQSLSPLRVLERGYAIASNDAGQVVTAADDVAVGDRIAIRLGRGSLDCRIEEIHGDRDDQEAQESVKKS